MDKNRFFQNWILPIIFAVLFAFLINKFVFFKVTVPTTSMLPTIKAGDQLIVTRVFDRSKLKRGDIVVFNSDELGKILVKRLIGLPGEKIHVDDNGQVFVNGEKIDEPYVISPEALAADFNVPEDSYLFFGDNRADSFDARKWDEPYINGDEIMGKARLRVYPLNRFGKIVSVKLRLIDKWEV